MSADFAASFFDYESVEVHERADELALLAGRPASDWAKVLAHTETRRFSRGETIISAGETDRALYLLTEGTLGVRLGQRTRTRPSRRSTRPRSSARSPSSTAARARRPCTRSPTASFLRLRMESYEMLAAREPELGRAILFDLARIVTQRLRLASDVDRAAGG